MGPAAAAALDFEALETALRRQVLELAARTVETHLNQDHSDATPRHNCSCGGSARYAGRRTKQFVTVLGPMRLARAYYHCGDCSHGFCPRDRALGLEGSSLSPALMRMVGAVASMVSFQESSQLLEELAGVDVGTKQVQRSAQALGEQVAGYERQTREPDSGLPLPSTLYLGLDGTGVPMRSTEVQGRAGKQPDGSARTREAKLCTVWSAERRDAQGRPQRDPHSVTYTAAIESAATLDTDPQLSEFARASRARKPTTPFWASATASRPGRRSEVDLESLRRALPGGGADSRSFPRQRATPYALEESVCRPPVRAGVGAKTLRGTRCRSDRDPPVGPRHRGLSPRGGKSGLHLFPRASTSHALRPVRGPGTLYLNRGGGSRMQKRHRGTTQTFRDALECAGS